MVGTGLAIGLGLASMGSKVAGAAISSHAAKGAAKDQQQAADRAIGVMDKVYYDQRRGMDPYAQMGAQAANTLTRLTNPGQPYTPRLQRQDAAYFSGPPAYPGLTQAPEQNPAGSRPRGLGPAVGEAMSRPSPYQPAGSSVYGRAAAQQQQGMTNMAQSRLRPPTVGGSSGLVTLEAPDGSRRQFSEDEAQQYIDRGARRVA